MTLEDVGTDKEKCITSHSSGRVLSSAATWGVRFNLYRSYKLHVHIINTIIANVKRKSAEATRLKARVSALLLQEGGL